MPRYVTLHWEPSFGAYGGRKSRKAFAYRAYIPDLIADADFAVPGEIAAVVDAASSAVRDLNVSPPKVGHLEVLARQLLRSESVASSRIERLVLSQRRLAKASYAGADARDPTAAEVLGNVRAMEQAVLLGARTRPFSPADVLAMEKKLFGPGAAGLRTEQNWIGGHPSNPRDAEISGEAARLGLKQLEAAGVVKQISVGKRNRAFEAVGLFEVIDRIEADALGR